MGGRVAPTNNGSVASLGVGWFMAAPYTPNIPRTHATICGAPNAIAMPRMAPRHHPQESRLAIAMPPSTMMRMMATGVSQARMFACSAVAPVRKGDASCDHASRDTSVNSTALPSAEVRRNMRLSVKWFDLRREAASGHRRADACLRFGSEQPRGLRLRHCEPRAFQEFRPVRGLELLPPDLARRAELEAVHYEGVVVLLLSLGIDPVVGANAPLDDQLIALAAGPDQRLRQHSECDEPHAGDHLPRSPLLVLAGIVVADQVQAGVGHIALGGDLRGVGQIADGAKRETVHEHGDPP